MLARLMEIAEFRRWLKEGRQWANFIKKSKSKSKSKTKSKSKKKRKKSRSRSKRKKRSKRRMRGALGKRRRRAL